MSLVQAVIRIVGRRGCASVSEVASELRGQHTTLQVRKAMHNARSKGHLTSIRGPGLGIGRGAAPGIFFPSIPQAKDAPPAKPRPLASVWELGQPVTCDKWPLPFDGGRVYAMTEEDEETA